MEIRLFHFNRKTLQTLILKQTNYFIPGDALLLAVSTIKCAIVAVPETTRVKRDKGAISGAPFSFNRTPGYERRYANQGVCVVAFCFFSYFFFFSKRYP